MDIVEHYNNTIIKSARNPLTSLLPTSLPPTSLPPTSLPPTSLPPTSLPPTSLPPTSLPLTTLLPAFKPPISLFPATSKKFNPYYTSTSLKRQANRIAAQNVKYKIAFKSYKIAILF